jgi:hypothetical protein
MHIKLWRTFGGLVIASIVLSWAALAFEGFTPELGSSHSDIVKHLAQGAMPARFAGGYLEAVGTLVTLFAALLLARLLRGKDEFSGWLASGIGATAVLGAGSALIVGYPAGAAAIYDGHHGASVETLAIVNDIRNFAFFLSITILGCFTACIGAAILRTRALPRWLAYSGFVIGLLCVLSVAAARGGAHNLASLAQTIWWLALGIAALRQRSNAPTATRPVHDSVTV